MFVLILHKSLPTVIQFLSMFPFSHIHCPFYALYSRIRIALPDFSPANLV